MSVLRADIRSEQRRGLGAPRVHDVHRARVDAAASCSCTATSIPTPAGEVLVLRVAGEVDLHSITVLENALTSGLARGPCHVLVDLAGLTFCSVRGLALLVQAGRTAAGRGTGYSVTAASPQADRAWAVLWPVGDLPTRYPSAAAGVVAAVAGSEYCHGDPMAPPARGIGGCSASPAGARPGTADQVRRSGRRDPSRAEPIEQETLS